MSLQFGPLEVAGLEPVTGSDPATLLFPGRVVFRTDTFKAKIYDGTKWLNLGSGGGGGGLLWGGGPSGSPIESEEYGIPIFEFDPSEPTTTRSVCMIMVPESFAGTQMSMYATVYSPSAAGNVLIRAQTYLIRKNLDAVNSTTNSHVSTNTELTNTVANQGRRIQLDLMDGSGQINAISVTAGDLLRIEIYRDSASETSSDTASTRFVKGSVEVSLG